MILASPETYAEAYSYYYHHQGYAKRAHLLEPLPDPILVVGCGFGFLVVELAKLGKQAYGIDASPYCWANRVTDNFTLWNVLDGPPPLFARTIVTESMLEWLTDDEARVAAKNCAEITPLVLHLVIESGQADYNYHTTGYWMTLTNQLTVSLEGT